MRTLVLNCVGDPGLPLPLAFHTLWSPARIAFAAAPRAGVWLNGDEALEKCRTAPLRFRVGFIGGRAGRVRATRAPAA